MLDEFTDVRESVRRVTKGRVRVAFRYFEHEGRTAGTLSGR